MFKFFLKPRSKGYNTRPENEHRPVAPPLPPPPSKIAEAYPTGVAERDRYRRDLVAALEYQLADCVRDKDVRPSLVFRSLLFLLRRG